MTWTRRCKLWRLIWWVADCPGLGLDYIIACIIHGAGAVDPQQHVDADDAERHIETMTARRPADDIQERQG